jgi:hypothetical protein
MSISSPTPEEFSRPARFSRAIAQVRRRSRLILLLRRALPAAIAAVFAVLIGWVLVRSVLTALSDLTRAATVIHMTNPHFYGQDDHGRDFVVSASEAQRSLRLAGVRGSTKRPPTGSPCRATSGWPPGTVRLLGHSRR